ncbi:MAG: nucleotidyltransferase domain-containing protein [Caldilineaceae bacterium]|nr:nucleotidyltransferase domain-containing protein [Caldilineaceae bacterium]MBP8107993.1 nucleotidyltransferase domain-containing protein [Caldilineaceae bacterium]MBP8125126.1 nucleotidyltransferase domain-containing protein [Caldilineaceae bacterium]MBP9074830.1 nucleotidyltransferase domain-containing protein [Caldilineaceae bacterium]
MQTKTQPTTYPLAEDVWPTGGVPLIKEAVSPYFLPVTTQILDEIVRRIVAALDPERIILFGSYAGGVPHADSDVDLFVVMETELPPARRELEVCRLLRPRPFPVDIIVKTPAEYQRIIVDTADFFRDSILRGRILFARP